MAQLSPKKKKEQMLKKYAHGAREACLRNAKATRDLQGFRNWLVDNLPIVDGAVLVDFGAGVGAQILRLVRHKGRGLARALAVDFALSAEHASWLESQSSVVEAFSGDATQACRLLEKETVDAVLLLGFLHELERVDSFAFDLARVLSKRARVLVADNDLYRSPERLSKTFREAGLDGNWWKLEISLGPVHIFRSISPESRQMMAHWRLGRVDRVFGILRPAGSSC